MRLIDADRLIKDIHDWNICKNEISFDEIELGYIIDEIEDQPTACSKERIPKVPDLYGDGYSDGEPIIDMYACPNCGKGYELECEKHKYCPNCGQAFDWSILEMEEDETE